MKNRIKKILLLVLIYILMVSNVKALEINSNHAILYNLNDDKIIYEKNAYEQVKIASLTKIMTATIVLENIENLKTTTQMTNNAYINLEGYALAGFKKGDVVTYEDLLYGLMLPSGAECANQLALSISGSKEEFVKLMNKKAKELGLNNTHFSNPIGADEIENYSTPYEVAQLLKYSLKNEEFYKIYTTKEYTTTNGIKLESTLKERTKGYDIDISNILGSKTGFTDEAGFCLASIANINNVKYLLVTTKANIEKPYQIIDAVNLYDYFSTNYNYKKILDYNKILATLPVKNGLKKEYKIYSDYDKYLYLNNKIDTSKITYEYEGVNSITKKIKQNEKLGVINIKYQNEILYVYDIYLNENIEYYNYLLIIGILIILVLLCIIITKKFTNKKKFDILRTE